jgi:uncharacterized protein with PIN domain
VARFLLDAMLGKLATYLRMCGHDAAYALDRGLEADDRLAAFARAEDRVLVTRDRELAGQVDGAVLLESKAVEKQLRALREAGVSLSLTTPERCAECNAELTLVPEDDPTPDYAPPRTAERRVWRCPDCGQHFWRGSHWDDVRATLAEL